MKWKWKKKKISSRRNLQSSPNKILIEYKRTRERYEKSHSRYFPQFSFLVWHDRETKRIQSIWRIKMGQKTSRERRWRRKKLRKKRTE